MKSKLKLIKDNLIKATSLPLSINYIQSTSTEKQSFLTFLFEELLLYNINIIGKYVEELQSELKEELLHKIKIKELEEKLKNLALPESVKFLIL